MAEWRATRFIAGTMQNQNAKLVANRQQQQKPNNNNENNNENRKKAFSKHSLELFARHVPSERDGERKRESEREASVRPCEVEVNEERAASGQAKMLAQIFLEVCQAARLSLLSTRLKIDPDQV